MNIILVIFSSGFHSAYLPISPSSSYKHNHHHSLCRLVSLLSLSNSTSLLKYPTSLRNKNNVLVIATIQKFIEFFFAFSICKHTLLTLKIMISLRKRVIYPYWTFFKSLSCLPAFPPCYFIGFKFKFVFLHSSKNV